MENFLLTKIHQRIENNTLRTLQNQNSLIDFSSNDYLGFAKSEEIKQNIASFLNTHPSYANGSTGSRLISGNSPFIEDLEQQIALFHHAEAGLIFNSGYDANVGLLSSISQRGDTIITDELVHASIIDGARLSYANRFIFKHNDLESLEQKIKNASGNVFIVTESIFSMDGDFAHLVQISALAKKYGANLIVDEAHATGVLGEFGKGMVCVLKLEDEVFARIHTFGKALGTHGAIVLGSATLRTFLINFARSFIYTTALPFHSLLSIKMAYQQLSVTKAIKDLNTNIQLFKALTLTIKDKFIPSDSAIQCMVIVGNKECKVAALKLQELGFSVKAILSPTVAEGKERIRICLHAQHRKEEIHELVKILQTI